MGDWRNCWFCDGVDDDKWTITTFTPPSTTDRLVTGISMWTSDDSGASFLKRSSGFTITSFVGENIAAGNCGTTPGGTKIAQKG